MAVNRISVRVTPRTARFFSKATPVKRRKLEILIDLRLQQLSRKPADLATVMTAIGTKAKRKGLTPSLLNKLLDD